MLAGRIEGAVNGGPVSLIAESQTLVLVVECWRTLLLLRRCSRSILRPPRELLTRAHLRLVVRMPGLGEVEVYPNPSFLVRTLLPMA